MKLFYFFIVVCLTQFFSTLYGTATHSTTHNFLTRAYNYTMNERYDEALELYLKLQQQYPNNPELLHSIGFVLKKQNKMHQAIEVYNQARALAPNTTKLLRALSHAHLALGEFSHGWPAYEYRWINPPHYNQEFKNYIQNNSTLAGKKIVLKTEYGLGDTLQFIRYAYVLKEMGAHVIVESQKPLVPLLNLCPYINQVIPAGASLPPYNLQALLMSMPLICNTTLATIPTRTPYLYADQKLVAYWHEKLKHDTKFKIGICWQAELHKNSTLTIVHKDAQAKSIPLELLASLSTLPNVQLYSLQKIHGTQQLDTLNKLEEFEEFHVYQFDDTFDETNGRFMDTAAVIKNLDLVITIDTSIAHLAGGLGVPTWVMLAYSADWRWLLHRKDSPWYPTMQLFRQPTYGDWHAVIQEIRKELTLIQKLGDFCHDTTHSYFLAH